MPRRRARRRNESLSYADIGLFAALAFAVTWWAIPQIQIALMSPEERRAVEQSVYYAGCDSVRAAGKDPIYAGQPGYRAGMDGDGDAVACEPYR